MEEKESYVYKLTKEDCVDFKNLLKHKLFMHDNGKVTKYNDHLEISFMLTPERKISILFYDYMCICDGFSAIIGNESLGKFVYKLWTDFLTRKFTFDYETDLKANAYSF